MPKIYPNKRLLKRQILDLHYCHDLSMVEISGRLGIPIQTIRQWFSRDWKLKANRVACRAHHRHRRMVTLQNIAASYDMTPYELFRSWLRDGVSQREMARRTGLDRCTIRKALVELGFIQE